MGIGDVEGRSEVRAMTIELKPEQERIIQQEIQSGHFRSGGDAATSEESAGVTE